MSLYFTSIPEIEFDLLMEGWLEPYGIRAVTNGDVGLKSDTGFLHVRGKPGGKCSFAIYGFMAFDQEITNAIQEVFNVELVTEADHRYHCFATEREYIEWRRETDTMVSKSEPRRRSNQRIALVVASSVAAPIRPAV